MKKCFIIGMTFVIQAVSLDVWASPTEWLSKIPKNTHHQKSIETLNSLLVELNNGFGAEQFREKADYSIQIVDSESVSHKIKTDFTNEIPKVSLQLTPTNLENPKSYYRDLILFYFTAQRGHEINSKYFTGQISNISTVANLTVPIFSELYFNANHGSVSALATLANFAGSIVDHIAPSQKLKTGLGLSPQDVSSLNTEILEQRELLKKKAMSSQRSQLKQFEEWKKKTRTLDLLEQKQEKLEDLILKNDRIGVANLIESYLPWPMMEPMEQEAWKKWLEAIKHPDLNNSQVLFRGISYDTDKMQRLNLGTHENIGFMSTLLTKNQGNYTRRLRSLQSSRLKNGNILNETEQKLPFDHIQITKQMESHAANPVASAFLSFTYSPQVASSFIGENWEDSKIAKGGLLAVRIDKRRVIPNLTSNFENEIELLVPMIIFPDEVVKYREGRISHPELMNFIEDVRIKTGTDFTSMGIEVWEADAATLNKQTEWTKKFFKEGNSYLSDLLNKNLTSMKRCSGLFK